jgi:hypothetical protein
MVWACKHPEKNRQTKKGGTRIGILFAGKNKTIFSEHKTYTFAVHDSFV